MKHFLSTQDWSIDDLRRLLDGARTLRDDPVRPLLAGKSIALVFFNPSLRTRASFELGAAQLGGHAVVLQPGKDAWPIEIEPGAIMDGEAEEHEERDGARHFWVARRQILTTLFSRLLTRFRSLPPFLL